MLANINMKKHLRITFGMTVIGAFTFGLIGMSNLNANNKVKLHHGSKVIEVSINAADKHLEHGDLVHKEERCACVAPIDDIVL